MFLPFGDGPRFLRVREIKCIRAADVNIEFVERVERSFNYSFEVYLRGAGESLTMSRRYAARLKDKMT